MGKHGLLGGAALAAVAWFLVPIDAEACGGTFCDAAPATLGEPMSMRVDQTGETVIFAFDETHVEAHVQISYDPNTPAERFAWIVPVMAVPEVSVGSQALFTNLHNATAPSFGFVESFQNCGGGGGGFDDGGYYDPCDGTGGDVGGAAGDGDETGGEDGATDGGGTQVVAEATVGAFDYVVLQSETVDDLMEWLKANEYYTDPAAVDVLADYIEEGAMFAAFRLTNGADVGEIHPITLRYEGNEPCIPLRLTRVAAKDDMDIRVFFLGDGRAYPTNFRHVELNPVKLDWVELGANYKALVSMAVDAEGADGHAFVTEFYGSTGQVSHEGLEFPLVDATVYKDIMPTDLVTVMQSQGLVGQCGLGQGCDWRHPLAQSIAASFLPVPLSLEEGEFYECPACFEDLIDTSMFDGSALVTAIDERIKRPTERAQRLLAEHPMVTRMYTTLSPHEMTEDPTFHESTLPELEVDHRSDILTRDNDCGGGRTMTLLDGRSVRMPDATWPDIAPDEMPFAEFITERSNPDASPAVLVDNSALIDELLLGFNGEQAAAERESRFRDCNDEGGSPGGAGADGGDDDGGKGSGGCGCSAPGTGPGGWMLMALGLALGTAVRRRG